MALVTVNCLVSWCLMCINGKVRKRVQDDSPDPFSEPSFPGPHQEREEGEDEIRKAEEAD